ncbi:MAG: hypothetical protein M3N47_15065, partial [Chloroflexota bacterium]|nr:hypothetical protein [Chloroflexota bacterium]
MPNDPSLPTCWNCDRRVPETVAATLRAPAGERVVLPPCRACHGSSYPPLVAEAGDVTPRADQGRTVLVVDDDPDLLWLLAAAFQDEGYAVDTAAHGLEALQRAGRSPSVFLRILLPDRRRRIFVDGEAP